jgi:hypothetical protein
VKRRQARDDARRIALGFATIALVAPLLAGCDIGSARKDPLELEAQRLETEKAELTRELEQVQTENVELAEQVKTLSALPEGKRLDLYKLTDVRISKYTNFYDKDGDGIREKLIVYVQAIDTSGDIVKAAGSVDVQLWNLNNPSDQALLGQWQVDPNELHKLWFSTMISASYRLTFDTPTSLDILADPLTVKVAFTDYLTGETFRTQEAIDPKRD